MENPMSWVKRVRSEGRAWLGKKGGVNEGAFPAPPRLPPPCPSTKNEEKRGGGNPSMLFSPPGLRWTANRRYSIYPRHFVLAPLHSSPYPSPPLPQPMESWLWSRDSSPLTIALTTTVSQISPDDVPKKIYLHPQVVSKSLKFTLTISFFLGKISPTPPHKYFPVAPWNSFCYPKNGVLA